MKLKANEAVMKIGIFDSGIGGLTIFSEIAKRLPDSEYLYLGDNARAPYGDRNPSEIYQFTKEGVEWLFSQGASLVVLACNTASSDALRRLQREWLPAHFPDRRILGIIIPIVQAVCAKAKGPIGIIGTKATVDSGAYVREFHKLAPSRTIIQVAAPLLVPLIEQGASKEQIKEPLTMYLSLFTGISLGALVLGCTHYLLIVEEIRSIMDDNVFIPNTGAIVAQSFAAYLSRHPEFSSEATKGTKGSQTFFTTGDPEVFSSLSKQFFGTTIEAQKISLPVF